MNITTQKRHTKSLGQSFLGFKKKLQKYLNNYEIKKIEKAFSLASKAHMGQYRKTGEDYIEHPLSAASILADFEMDYETLMAAILHDVIEDTDYDKNYIQKTFGEKISELVSIQKKGLREFLDLKKCKIIFKNILEEKILFL